MLGSLNFTVPGGNANWKTSAYVDPSTGGFGGLNNDDHAFVIDSWINWAPKFANDKLLLGLNGDYGQGDLNLGAADTTWYGVAGYAKYQFTDIFSLAGRGDWIHEHGTSKFNPSGTGEADIWSFTLTAGFDLLENFLFRAEYRFDHGEDIRGVAADSDWAHTAALQAVYTF
jgi:hypothetical protein